LKTTVAPGHRPEQGALKDGSSTDEPGSSQGRIGPRSETSVDNKAKPGVEKILEEVVEEQDRVLEVKENSKIDVRINS
jgi:hypothetical protein